MLGADRASDLSTTFATHSVCNPVLVERNPNFLSVCFYGAGSGVVWAVNGTLQSFSAVLPHMQGKGRTGFQALTLLSNVLTVPLLQREVFFFT